jgi:hypothetical protein
MVRKSSQGWVFVLLVEGAYPGINELENKKEAAALLGKLGGEGACQGFNPGTTIRHCDMDVKRKIFAGCTFVRGKTLDEHPAEFTRVAPDAHKGA